VGHLFGVRLRELRTERRLHQRNLEELLNLRAGTVSQYERGLREPGFDLLLAVADVFDTTVDYLLGRVGAQRASHALLLGRERLSQTMRQGRAGTRAGLTLAVEPTIRAAEWLRLAQQVAPEVFGLPRLAARFAVPVAALRLWMEGEAELPGPLQQELARYMGLAPEMLPTPK
jgi:transcriptional regulator with XRE-family HTH domain